MFRIPIILFFTSFKNGNEFQSLNLLVEAGINTDFKLDS